MADLFDPSEPLFEGETFEKFIDNLFTGQRQLLPADPSLKVRLKKAQKLFETVLFWDIFNQLSYFIRVFDELECETLTLSEALNKFHCDHQLGLHFYAQSATHVTCCQYYLDSLETRYPEQFYSVKYHRSEQTVTSLESTSIYHTPIATADVNVVSLDYSEVLAKTNNSQQTLVLPMQITADVCENGGLTTDRSFVAPKPITSAIVRGAFDVVSQMNPDMLITAEDFTEVQHFSCGSVIRNSTTVLAQVHSEVRLPLSSENSVIVALWDNDADYVVCSQMITDYSSVPYPVCFTASTHITDFCFVSPSTVTQRKRRWYYGRHNQKIVESHQAQLARNLCFIHECHWYFSLSVRTIFCPRTTQWYNSNLRSQPLVFGHCTVEGGGDKLL